MSNGTPTSATSISRDISWRWVRMKVAIPAKRGVMAASTGWNRGSFSIDRDPSGPRARPQRAVQGSRSAFKLTIHGIGEPHELVPAGLAGDDESKILVEPIAGRHVAPLGDHEGRVPAARIAGNEDGDPPLVGILIHQLRRRPVFRGEQPSAKQGIAFGGQIRKLQWLADTLRHPR